MNFDGEVFVERSRIFENGRIVKSDGNFYGDRVGFAGTLNRFLRNAFVAVRDWFAEPMYIRDSSVGDDTIKVLLPFRPDPYPEPVLREEPVCEGQECILAYADALEKQAAEDALEKQAAEDALEEQAAAADAERKNTEYVRCRRCDLLRQIPRRQNRAHDRPALTGEEKRRAMRRWAHDMDDAKTELHILRLRVELALREAAEKNRCPAAAAAAAKADGRKSFVSKHSCRSRCSDGESSASSSCSAESVIAVSDLSKVPGCRCESCARCEYGVTN